MLETPQRSSKQRDAERSRKLILQAALDEFAEKGFLGSTVRSIAERIDLSHGMLRYHYESKEKLWIAAVDYLFERASKTVGMTPTEFRLLEGGDLEIYRNFLRRIVYYSAKHPEHSRIVTQESILKSARLDYYASTYVREQVKLFDELVRILKDQGIIPAYMTTLSYYYLLAGAISNPIIMTEESRIAFGSDVLNEEAVQNHCDAIIEIFCPKTS